MEHRPNANSNGLESLVGKRISVIKTRLDPRDKAFTERIILRARVVDTEDERVIVEYVDNNNLAFDGQQEVIDEGQPGLYSDETTVGRDAKTGKIVTEEDPKKPGANVPIGEWIPLD